MHTNSVVLCLGAFSRLYPSYRLHNTILSVLIASALIDAYRVPSSASSLTDTLSTTSYLIQTLAAESATLSTRTINTKYGSLRGSVVRLNRRTPYTTTTLELPDIETYLGVPYATPPTGGLRFMPPVTPTHWRGVRLANRQTPVCPQKLTTPQLILAMRANESEALKQMPRARYEYLRMLIPLLSNQSEDCLYLNIYTPVTQTRSGLF